MLLQVALASAKHSNNRMTTLKELATAFNELDLRAYSRADGKAGTIVVYSPKTKLYHFMNHRKDPATNKWVWLVGDACEKQPSVATSTDVDA